jgi:hypothetical protein
MKGGWTQNTNLDYKIGVKLYNLTTLEETMTKSDSSSFSIYKTTTTLQILHPTVAVQWKTKKSNFHEIELTSFILGKLTNKTETIVDSTNNVQTESVIDLITTSISARYEYILNFNKLKNRKLVPSLGFGINPYYKQYKYSPETSSSFPTSLQYIGAKIFVTPRLTYYLGSKFFVDINIPICFLDGYALIDKEDNPVLPVEERTITTFNFNGFPMIFCGRIGVGLKL